MGVIDFHTHPWIPRDLAAGTETFIREISPAVQRHGDRLSDPSFAADRLREQGVERAVVLPEHCPETSGNVRTETVLKHCAAEPDLYIPFASVNPVLDPDPPGLLRTYVNAGARGLKLYPSYQFFHLDDALAYSLYPVCSDAGIPVLVHVGSSVLPGTRLEYCHPDHLEPVAQDFPDLQLVMAHGGRGHWYDRCAQLALEYSNVHIDVAGLVPAKLPEYFPALPDLVQKMVFGSDWPAMPRSVEHNIGVIRTLGLGDEALDGLLRENARRLLGL